MKVLFKMEKMKIDYNKFQRNSVLKWTKQYCKIKT